MPADSSHNPQARRISRKHASEDDIDVRRARGEVSCAECRRLKLKCDKKLPCSSCVRRGVHSICPNGKMAAGQGTRFVLADTSQLHTKITEMGQRIRQLEDALAISHSGISNELHPLLRDELLSIKFGPENGTAPRASRDPSVESIDAFGTLTIFDRDVSKYFGRSAGSETLLLAGAEMEPSWIPDVDQPSTSTLTQDILRLSNLFPMCAEANSEKTMDLLFSHLPEQPRAWALCETYLEQASWQFQPIRRDELIDDILVPIYRSQKDRASSELNRPHTISPHRLATLYIVFAIGALVDLTLEPYSPEAESFALLCRAAISLRSVFDSPEICTVQTIALLAQYHTFAGKRYTLDNAWTVMSLAAKLAQSLGLHRDGSRWDFDAKTVDRRRSLFYELFCSEQFHSLALGRPPALRPSYVDCEFPTDNEPMMDEKGRPQMGYFQWKYEFCRDILAQVLELTLTAEPPSYQIILDLDRKIREKTLPPHLNVFMSAEDEHCTPAAYMRRCNLGQYRSVTLLFLHRSFFAQAMLDHPVNPLRSPYAPSFLAAYRCASGVIKSSLNHYDRFPDLCRRWWNVGSQLFSAAIIVGSIVTRSPSSAMAPNAFIELGLACDLFEKCTSDSRRSRSGLAILNRLRDKAFQIFSQLRSGTSPISSSLYVGRDYGDDELALFGGQTRVLFSKLLLLQRNKQKSHAESSANTPISPSNSDSPAPSDTSDSKDNSSENLPDVHPSLMEYISLLPPSQHPRSPPSELAVEQLYNTNPFIPTSFPESQMQNLYISSPEATPQGSSPDGQSFSRFFSDLGNLSMGTFTAEPAAMNDNASAGDLMNLDLVMTDSGIDQHWRSFMRDSGLLDHGLSS
ncbi:fungal-specific transcription factor domain-containing protein [Lentinula detonsa]|uniref:Fungal-specific transcription factor domain-containing protein n=1 Tax=Lentinula detonsa TaxID=2804962 RepID=A0AA38Q411_9AGAR|nr:fungal-specific transcription factor domain-containing protein [Lentinula detonsa]